MPALLVRRSEEAESQLNDAHSLLNAVHFPPCSDEEVALMQQLAVTSNYIQAIGRISDNQLTAVLSAPVRLSISGPPT